MTPEQFKTLLNLYCTTHNAFTELSKLATQAAPDIYPPERAKAFTEEVLKIVERMKV